MEVFSEIFAAAAILLPVGSEAARFGERCSPLMSLEKTEIFLGSFTCQFGGKWNSSNFLGSGTQR